MALINFNHLQLLLSIVLIRRKIDLKLRLFGRLIVVIKKSYH